MNLMGKRTTVESEKTKNMLIGNLMIDKIKPETARIIFLSSDANYSPEISNHSFFNYILEYQKDSIAFWKKYGCHHPFLLPNYPFNKSTGGVPFHRNFSKVGLGPEYAEYICFPGTA